MTGTSMFEKPSYVSAHLLYNFDLEYRLNRTFKASCKCPVEVMLGSDYGHIIFRLLKSKR